MKMEIKMEQEWNKFAHFWIFVPLDLLQAPAKKTAAKKGSVTKKTLTKKVKKKAVPKTKKGKK